MTPTESYVLLASLILLAGAVTLTLAKVEEKRQVAREREGLKREIATRGPR